jgi:hypothetical protein
MCHNFRKCPRFGPARQPLCTGPSTKEKKGREGEIGFPLLPRKRRLLPDLRSLSSRTSRERWEGEAAAAAASSPSLTGCYPASGAAQGRLQGVRFDRRDDVSGRFDSSPHRCFRLRDGRGFGYPFFLGISGWRSPEELGSSHRRRAR